MPDDPLNTDTPATPIPSRERRGCVCEFCECTLAPSGEVLKMGDAAKIFRKHEEIVEKKDNEITRLTAELAEAKRERDALKAASDSSGLHHGGRIEIRR